MLQRNGAPMPLNLATSSQDSVDPRNSSSQPRIDDLPVPSKSTQGKINHPLFSSNFNFAAGALP